jgi:hypothetical protein
MTRLILCVLVVTFLLAGSHYAFQKDYAQGVFYLVFALFWRMEMYYEQWKKSCK